MESTRTDIDKQEQYPRKDMDEQYPTEEVMRYIEEFEIKGGNAWVLVDCLQEWWWRGDILFRMTEVQDTPPFHPALFRRTLQTENKTVMLIEMHTGGWSGNEQLLRALKKNKWFYTFYWEKSERGGHEYFRLEKRGDGGD